MSMNYNEITADALHELGFKYSPSDSEKNEEIHYDTYLFNGIDLTLNHTDKEVVLTVYSYENRIISTLDQLEQLAKLLYN